MLSLAPAGCVRGRRPLLPRDAKPKKPRLDLRATPRMAFSPVNVFLTAELTGGDDVEDYHCPELEWDWDDGGKSTAGGRLHALRGRA